MGRTAQGRLSFERVGGLTASRAVYAESPLRLLTPRSRGPGALVFTSTLGGGLLGGDRLRLEISVGRGARACICTQGPTRVFRSQRGCSSELFARVEEDAALVLAPDPVACFAGARFEQRTEVELSKAASLSLWEVLSAGRDGWGFARCRSALSVRRAGKALVDEAWLLDPAHGALSQRLGRFQAIATLVLAGPLFSSVRGFVKARVEAAPVKREARLLEAVSPLDGDALLLRLAGASVEEVMLALRTHLAAIPSLLGDDPWRRDAPHAA
jgi:urease accessory protein